MGFGPERGGDKKVDKRYKILQYVALKQGGPLHPHFPWEFNES